MKVGAKLKEAVPYLHNEEVRAQFIKTLNQLEADHEEAGLDQSSEMDECLVELNGAMNAFDEGVSEKRAEAKEAAAEGHELEAES